VPSFERFDDGRTSYGTRRFRGILQRFNNTLKVRGDGCIRRSMPPGKALPPGPETRQQTLGMCKAHLPCCDAIYDSPTLFQPDLYHVQAKMAFPAGAFAAGIAIALLGLRLVLAVIHFIRSKRRRRVNTMVVLGSGASRRLLGILANWSATCNRTLHCMLLQAIHALRGPPPPPAFRTTWVQAATPLK
jgi:hypothetical protein